MATRVDSEFRAQVIQSLEDPVSFNLMANALTLVPCGHILNEDTVNEIFQRTGLCPIDRTPIQRTVPNYHVRWLVEVENNPQLKEKDPTPSQEAIDSFSRGKEFYNEGNYDASIAHFLDALRCCPTFEKVQVWLDAALAREQNAQSSSFPTASRRRPALHTHSYIPPYAPPVRLDPQRQTSQAVTQATAGVRTRWEPEMQQLLREAIRRQELQTAQMTAAFTASMQAIVKKFEASEQLLTIQKVTKGEWSFSLCSLKERDDNEIALAAIRRNFRDIRFASNRLRADRFIQQEALREAFRQGGYISHLAITPYFINYTPPAKASPRKNSSCTVL